MGGTVRRLRNRLEGLYEVAHRYYREGDAERVADVLEGIERIEDRELPVARRRARVETAERMADPDREPATIPEGAPFGWGEDSAIRAMMSPGLQRTIFELEAAEATEAARVKRQAEELAEVRREEAAVRSWQDDVVRGLASVADLGAYTAGLQGGNQPGDVLAQAVAAQDQEDATNAAAVTRYGQVVLALLGPDVPAERLEALLAGAQVGARHGRERGWG